MTARLQSQPRDRAKYADGHIVIDGAAAWIKRGGKLEPYSRVAERRVAHG